MKTPTAGKAGIGAHFAIFNLPSKPIWECVSIERDDLSWNVVAFSSRFWNLVLKAHVWTLRENRIRSDPTISCRRRLCPFLPSRLVAKL